MFRKTLAYSLCLLIGAPLNGALVPVGFAQQAAAARPAARPAPTPAPAPAPAAAPTAATAAQRSGLRLDGAQARTAARLVLTWANGNNRAAASLSGSLLLIRLPAAMDVDPAVLQQKAPNFIAAAAISADKRTLRLALLQPVTLSNSRDGNVQAIDLVTDPTAAPPPVNAANPLSFAQTAPPPQTPEQEVAAARAPTAAGPAGPLPRLRMSQAPAGAPRVRVEAMTSANFTRLRLHGPALPDPQFARHGDRLAVAFPGKFAMDLSAVRGALPQRLADIVRYSDDTHTSLVMDVGAGTVVRHRHDGADYLIDIYEAGTSGDPMDLLAQQAANARPANGAPKEEAKPADAQAGHHPADGDARDGAHADAHTDEGPAPSTTTALAPAAVSASILPDPAPSGLVRVTSQEAAGETIVTIPFEGRAPATIFRRGNGLYAVFPTKARFDISAVRPNRHVMKAQAFTGENANGIRFEIAPEAAANVLPTAHGWLLRLSGAQGPAGRTITIRREQAADGTGRIKAIMADGAAIGHFVDPAAGDEILVGMALGPPSALLEGRSFLEATIPQSQHGLAVILRRDDLELRRDIDGFVLVRPTGLTLSAIDGGAQATGFATTNPGFVDFINWRQGPSADFMRHLDHLRRAAAMETGKPEVRARLDLARFLLAWQLAPEALGILREVRAVSPQVADSPDVLGLTCAAQAMEGRGREALATASSPGLLADPASQLWAAMAASQAGDPTEVRRRFEIGRPALHAFAPEASARFLMANAQAALDLNDPARARVDASAALEAATDEKTKAEANLLKGRALAALGEKAAAKTIFTSLAGHTYAPIAARASYENALLDADNGQEGLLKAIHALDSLRFVWRGDEFEIDLLRKLGDFYIQAGDLRSGLSTLASAMTLRPELPAARALREDLSKNFRSLFLEGGADGMDPMSALALFYDFRQLTPPGPDGDRIVRGLADRLVSLDLLDQAADLLQHQVDNRLDGFAKAQVATDLAAIYLMNNKNQEALTALANSRSALLPEALNRNRRMIEAIAMAGLQRYDHAMEALEFEKGPKVDAIKSEIEWMRGDYAAAASSARAHLPAAGAELAPDQSAQVLRATLAASLARDGAMVDQMDRQYGTAMGKTGFAETFKMLTSDAIPDAATVQTAVNAVNGASPMSMILRDLRADIAAISPSEGVMAFSGPTDANPGGGGVRVAANRPSAPQANEYGASDEAAIGNVAEAPAPAPRRGGLHLPQLPHFGRREANRPAAARPATSRPAQRSTQRSTQRPAQANRPVAQNGNRPNRNRPDNGFQAPRDPPIVAGR